MLESRKLSYEGTVKVLPNLVCSAESVCRCQHGIVLLGSFISGIRREPSQYRPKLSFISYDRSCQVRKFLKINFCKHGKCPKPCIAVTNTDAAKGRSESCAVYFINWKHLYLDYRQFCSLIVSRILPSTVG